MRTTYQDIVPVVALVHDYVDQRSQHERKRRRRKHRAKEEDLFEEPEESVELGDLPEIEEKKPSTTALLATASSLGGFVSLTKRRKATLEEELAAATWSPGCLVPSLTRQLREAIRL